MEVLGLDDIGELKLAKDAKANLAQNNQVTDRAYNNYLQDYMDYCHNEQGNGLTCEKVFVTILLTLLTATTVEGLYGPFIAPSITRTKLSAEKTSQAWSPSSSLSTI